MKTYSEKEVLEIIKQVQSEVQKSAYTYTAGQSDGYECWDTTEIGFNIKEPQEYLKQNL